MIISKIQGGIGNQMFQYALGKALSIKNNTELLLDINHYSLKNSRPFDLDKFQTNIKIASQNQISKITSTNFIDIIKYFRHSKFKNYISEKKEFNFDKQILEAGNNVYLNGYWQSEKYFYLIENVIRNEFLLKKPLPSNINNLVDMINTTNSVSVHIRRGDYLVDKNKNKFYQCPVMYYEDAIKLISERIDHPKFIVFSDDLDQVNDIKFPEATIYIDKKCNLLPHQELILMSLCKNQIIANSSFSWWGAWLNNNKQKIVITPKRYLLDKTVSIKDWTLPTWINI